MDNTPFTPATPAGPALPPADPAQVVASAWADQALWSQVANHLGNSIRFWRNAAAAAGVAGLFVTLLASSLGPDRLGGSVGQKTLAAIGVLLLALAPYLRQKLLSTDRVLEWTRARNVAEQLKEAIYRHLMGALAPVALADGSAPPDPAGPGNLVRRCRAIKQQAADLALLAATAKPEPRQRKTVMVLADYLSDRLDGQIQYYRKASLAAGTNAQQLQQAEFILGLLGVLLGALAGNLLPTVATPGAPQASLITPWLALIVTVTAAISSHIAATRNSELAAKYFATHDLLKTLRDEWQVAPDRDAPARVLRLVDEVEHAIAAEHGGWVSDWRQALNQSKLPAAELAQTGGSAADAPAPAAVPAPAGAAVVAEREPEPEPAAPEPELLPPEPGPAAPEPEPEPEPTPSAPDDAPPPAADPNRPKPG